MAIDPFASGAVLPAPIGAQVLRDLPYLSSESGVLRLDAYRPADRRTPLPAVLLVNGDADEETISRAKDWAVFGSYGEHLASRGLVGISFAHHSSGQGRQTALVAQEIAAAISYVREHASELEVDPERLGIWAFSGAGPFTLAPLLRQRHRFIRAVAGFYAVWDVAPFRDLPLPPPMTEGDEWSATEALGLSSEGLPAIFIARAWRDGQRIKAGTDLFVARALALDVDLELHDHPTGQHGFDTRDDDARSRGIIEAALNFFVMRLA